MPRLSPRASGKVRAFTLVEAMLVIAVLGVVLALSLPQLSRAKTRATEATCLANMRSVHLVIAEYAVDHRDGLPFAGMTEGFVAAPWGGQVRLGGVAGLWNGRWTVLFPDYWSDGRWTRDLRCPKQAEFDPLGQAAASGPDPTSPVPHFWLSSATWLDPATLRADSAPADARPSPNQLSAVVFPSKKVLMFEQRGLCVTGPSSDFWKFTVGQTFLFPTSTALTDGSAARIRQSEGLPATFSSMPFNATVDGVRGRDVR